MFISPIDFFFFWVAEQVCRYTSGFQGSQQTVCSTKLNMNLRQDKYVRLVVFLLSPGLFLVVFLFRFDAGLCNLLNLP